MKRKYSSHVLNRFFPFLIVLSCFTSTMPVNAGIPSYPGFYVKGRFLYDPTGERVVLRGVNAMLIYYGGNRDPKSYAEVAKTGANCMRIMWMNNGSIPVSTLDSVLTLCIKNGMIPIPELHNTTCQWNVTSTAQYWLRPDVVQVLRKHQRSLIVNICNEASAPSFTEYQQVYSDVVRQMRQAGIHVPLMVDGSACGNDYAVLLEKGPSMVRSDPDHNMIFSWHLYRTTSGGGTEQRIEDVARTSIDSNICLISGEFANKAPGCICCIEYRGLIRIFQEYALGWMPWSWGFIHNSDCAEFDMTSNATYAGLVRWGLEVAVTNPFSIQNTSVRPQYMRELRLRTPSAHLYPDKKTGRAPLTVRFDASSSYGQPLKYQWQFGDGSSGNDDSIPSHTYEREGVYRVRLAVSCSTVTDTVSSLISVCGPGAKLVLLSQNKPLVAIQMSTNGEKANDGSDSTAWISGTDSIYQWIRIDLGQQQLLQQIQVHWGSSFAKVYHVQVSNDNRSWTDAGFETKGNGGKDTLCVTGEGRYVRLLALIQSSRLALVVNEFMVYGPGALYARKPHAAPVGRILPFEIVQSPGFRAVRVNRVGQSDLSLIDLGGQCYWSLHNISTGTYVLPFNGLAGGVYMLYAKAVDSSESAVIRVVWEP